MLYVALVLATPLRGMPDNASHIQDAVWPAHISFLVSTYSQGRGKLL